MSQLSHVHGCLLINGMASLYIGTVHVTAVGIPYLADATRGKKDRVHILTNNWQISTTLINSILAICQNQNDVLRNYFRNNTLNQKEHN